jgi:hypothetical protein
MKKITMFIVIVLAVVGCSQVKMTYNGNQDYQEIRKEKKNMLLVFNGYPDYIVEVRSGDIDLNFNLDVEIQNGGVVLLENVPQGYKTFYVKLVDKIVPFSADIDEAEAKERALRREGKIVVHIGPGPNDQHITNPKDTNVQLIVDLGSATCLQKEKRNIQKKQKEKRNILLTFNGYPDHVVEVTCDDISPDSKLDVIIENGGVVLLEEISQGYKTFYVKAINKIVPFSADINESEAKERTYRRQGKIVVYVGPGPNDQHITNPKDTNVQLIVDLGSATCFKEIEKPEKPYYRHPRNKEELEELRKKIGKK